MTPGCGCSGELVTEVAKELQQRCSVRVWMAGMSRNPVIFGLGNVVVV